MSSTIWTKSFAVTAAAAMMLSLAACQKPADKVASADSAAASAATAADAAKAATASAASATTAASGLPAECDDYFKKVDACVAKMGASSPFAAQFKSSAAASRAQFASMADKTALASSCKQATDMFTKTSASMCPGV